MPIVQHNILPSSRRLCPAPLLGQQRPDNTHSKQYALGRSFAQRALRCCNGPRSLVRREHGRTARGWARTRSPLSIRKQATHGHPSSSWD
ncbi:hypothetical protein B0T18DRAFT_160002 [Schizothecium vesticola]|uniref:Uncharacterized protein n=1 Tax=Schizothecium vesticola TaxID=314040 RepID=A0AA40EWT9_9PEZI|nr:hypothetical protein B0T18DRAFT_160002 [Schizothecium vesticola]